MQKQIRKFYKKYSSWDASILSELSLTLKSFIILTKRKFKVKKNLYINLSNVFSPSIHPSIFVFVHFWEKKKSSFFSVPTIVYYIVAVAFPLAFLIAHYRNLYNIFRQTFLYFSFIIILQKYKNLNDKISACQLYIFP